MKNLLALLTFSTLIVLGGCKKGEEDPSISFSSRDGRITGEWELVSGSLELIQTKINSVEGSTARRVTDREHLYTISSGKASYIFQIVEDDVINESSVVNYDDFAFEMFLNVQKDASYVNTFSGQLVGSNGQPKKLVDKSTGYWTWINSGKNKVGITFKGIDSYANSLLSGDYKITRLSGSELILVRNTVSSSQQTADGSNETDEYSEKVELTFSKK